MHILRFSVNKHLFIIQHAQTYQNMITYIKLCEEEFRGKSYDFCESVFHMMGCGMKRYSYCLQACLKLQNDTNFI